MKSKSAVTRPLYPIYPASPIAEAMIEPNTPREYDAIRMARNAKYPFSLLRVGDAFAVPWAHVPRTTIAVAVVQYNAALNRKFVLVTHADLQLTEVARIA